jgi:hypothetical protein
MDGHTLASSHDSPQNHDLGQAHQPGGRALPTYTEAGDAVAAAFVEGEDSDTTKLLIAGYIPFQTKKKVVVLRDIVVF